VPTRVPTRFQITITKLYRLLETQPAVDTTLEAPDGWAAAAEDLEELRRALGVPMAPNVQGVDRHAAADQPE
jgi:hypothetical protein